MIFMSIPPSPLTHILSQAPLIVTAPLTFICFFALSMSHTDDISHVAVEATELEFQLPVS